MDNIMSGWERNDPYQRLVTDAYILTLLVGDGSTGGPLDVDIELGDGVRRFATFFTLDDIKEIKDRHRRSGECLAGGYLWATNMIIVESTDRDFVKSVIDDLTESGEIATAFGSESESISE